MARRSDSKKDPFGWLSIPFDSLSKVKLPGGVVGKVSMVLIALAISDFGISWSARSETVAITAILTGAAVVVLLGLRLIAFAEKHTQTALMEGAEFLIHEQIQQIGMKSQPSLPANHTDYMDEPKELTVEAVSNLPKLPPAVGAELPPEQGRTPEPTSREN